MCFSCYRSSWRLCPLRGFSGGTSIFSITFKRTSSTASVGRSSFNIWFRLSYREWKITPHSYLSSSRVTLPSLNLHTSILSFLRSLPALPVPPWLSGSRPCICVWFWPISLSGPFSLFRPSSRFWPVCSCCLWFMRFCSNTFAIREEMVLAASRAFDSSAALPVAPFPPETPEHN